MVCDTRTLPGQTLSQRKDEVKGALRLLGDLIARGKVRPQVAPNGVIFFEGWLDQERGRVSDGCAYRLLMATGGSLVKAKIAAAEAMAGRGVNRQAVAQGLHTRDGGRTYHTH